MNRMYSFHDAAFVAPLRGAEGGWLHYNGVSCIPQLRCVTCLPHPSAAHCVRFGISLRDIKAAVSRKQLAVSGKLKAVFGNLQPASCSQLPTTSFPLSEIRS